MGKLTLILGGARSGKSTYAQNLAMTSGKQVAYIATARALDSEMETRILNHRRERPESWITLEIPKGMSQLNGLLPSHANLVLLDCLTMLVTNLILDITQDENAPDELAANDAVETEIDALKAAIHGSERDWIIVSNEVGLGLVPPYPLGRLFRDALGRANQRLADNAEEVILMVAGIPVPIHTFRIRKET
jgi:adenosylcobinamide kinase / adenosylcobinamide-phosphate guanylyltransferase